MRIAVEASALLMRSAGVKTYLYHWIRNMSEEARVDTIHAFPRIQFPLPPLHHNRSILSFVSTVPRLFLLHASKRRLPGVFRLAQPPVDVFHASSQMQTPPKGLAVTATIYDMTCWTLPEYHTPGNVAAEQRYAERVLKQARGMIAISEASKRDAVRILGVAEHRIAVVHPGVGAAYFAVNEEQRERARGHYRLAKPYFLFVSTIEPRKNVDRLLDAWQALAPSTREAFELVLAGPAGWRSPETMARLKRPPAGVRYLSYVEEEILPGLVGGAAALVYPSLYEGFGLPVAQAMAAGVPVITSNVSSLPEVAGDAAVLVDPKSEASIAGAMERVALSPSLRADLAQRGAARAARMFTWKRSAQASLEFFHKVAG